MSAQKVTPTVGFLLLIMIFAMAAFLAIPAAFFLMLFLGNLGVHVGFIGAYPGALVLAALKSKTSTVKAS